MITHFYESTYMKICKSGSSVREVTLVHWKMKEMEQGKFFIHNLNHHAFCVWQHCRYDMMRIDLPFLLWVDRAPSFMPCALPLGGTWQRARTERSFALNVTWPNVIYTACWKTDETCKMFSCYSKKSRKSSVLKLGCKIYQYVENSHRGNFHRIIGLGQNVPLKTILYPTCSDQRHLPLEQIAQSPVQPVLEYFQKWGIHTSLSNLF